MGRERRGHTLQPTALVNEAFLRLTDARQVRWQDRAHFLGISARLMRRVLVDHARSRGYRKRGAGALQAPKRGGPTFGAPCRSIWDSALPVPLSKTSGVERNIGLIDTDRGDTLVFHLGMSGRWRIDPGQIEKHDHFLIETDEGRTLALNDPRRFACWISSGQKSSRIGHPSRGAWA